MTICRVHPMTWDRVVQRTMPAPSRGGQTDALAICNESFIEMNLNEFYGQFSEKDNDPHSRRALDIASFPCKSTLWGLPQSKKLFETRNMIQPLSSNLRLWDQFPESQTVSPGRQLFRAEHGPMSCLSLPSSGGLPPPATLGRRPGPSWHSSAPNPAALGPWTADMAKIRNSDRKKTDGRSGPAPTVVEVRCIPAPDAQERLRKIFTILARHTAGDGVPELEEDSALEDSSEVEC